jgi:peptidoglycan/LPS O-acetylase OafA/YrhL
MSYSFYLSHSLTLHCCKLLANRLLGVESLNTAAYSAIFAATFLIASAASATLFVFVEKPLSLTKTPQLEHLALVQQTTGLLEKSSTPIIST